MSDGIEIKIKSYFNVVQPVAYARIDAPDPNVQRATFVAKAKQLADYLGGPISVVARPNEIELLVEEFYALPGNGAGGLLHIVLDDGNTEQIHVEFCRQEARKAGDEPAYWMAQVLLALTDEERRRVCAGDDEDDGDL